MNIETFSQNFDDLHSDTIVVPIFEDEKPPQDLAGLLDWRLNGFISRGLKDKTIKGSFGEATLIPIFSKISARRVLLVGMGQKSEFHLDKAKRLGMIMGQKISSMGTVDVATRIRQAKDEKRKDETQECVFQSLKSIPKLENTFVKIIDDKVFLTV